ncbi:MAG TPA: SAM-dependent chlorinase/fluorinase [Thermoanaerobaculia bacterium]|nr:SAM-dependent chlorinase/fluorinase [Thermoanaerobaculia bacterium]
MTTIALLTDFGTRDPYVAAVKGVIAARCDARIEDLTHEIAPFDVFGAAWFLRSVFEYWPEGTIFVVVVDPGVGTTRRILAADRDGKTLLAPDNGVLTFIAGGVHAVENDSFFLPNGSNTFHGRDRFAPVAAAIANGARLEELGPRVDDFVRVDYTPPSYAHGKIEGTIVAVDRYGNLITDIEVAKIGFEPVLRSGGHVVDRLERNYGDAKDGPFLIAGSTGCIELSVANGSAAELLQLGRGEKVSITPK